MTAEAWCTLKGERQDDNQETEHEQRYIDESDDFPAAEPSLSVPTHRLDSTPETMGEVEPYGSNPYDVENDIDGIAKGSHDLTKAIGWSRVEMDRREQLGKHHVVPEVVQVENQTEQDDDT